MRFTEAMSSLPDPYAEALRIAVRAPDEAAVADAMGLPEESISSLLALAVAKLETLMEEESP